MNVQIQDFFAGNLPGRRGWCNFVYHNPHCQARLRECDVESQGGIQGL